jgi:hypothetical protein
MDYGETPVEKMIKVGILRQCPVKQTDTLQVDYSEHGYDPRFVTS